jgi:phage gp45-like
MNISLLPASVLRIWQGRAVTCMIGLGLLAVALNPDRAAGTQTITHQNLGDIQNSNSVVATTEFFDVPAAAALTVTFDVTFQVTPPTPGRLKVVIFPGEPDPSTGAPPRDGVLNGVIIPSVALFPVWDHERLVDSAGHALSHIHGVAALPASFDGKPLINGVPTEGSDPVTYIYTVQVVYDNPGQDSTVVATFDSCSLIIDPDNSGHTAPPTVNIFNGGQNQPLPTQINYGDSLNLFATAQANPLTYTIARLGIIINTAEPIVHNGSLAPLLRSQVVSQHAASGASVFYQPPILPPGDYTIVVRAVDSAGFYQIISRPLRVQRLFGLFSVSDLVATVNSDSNDPNCPACNSTNFSATILYSNNGTTPSNDLRIRLVEVPSASFLDVDGPPPLPDPKTPTDASVGPVHALAAGSSDEVAVSGIIDAPIFVTSNSGFTEGEFINFHVYAVLDEFIDGQWVPVDSLKLADGVQLSPTPFGGPGDGSNMPPSGNGTAGLATLSDVTISGALTSASLGEQQFTATGFFTNSSVTISSPVTWQVVGDPAVTIDPSSGMLQAGHVGTDTVVQVSATMAINGQTKTETVSVTIKAGPRFGSIATRGFITNSTGALIGGFSISGTVPKSVLIRAIGPSLSAYFNNPLSDPTLALFDASGHGIVSNNDWGNTPNVGQIPINLRPADPKEAAILITLSPGQYTAVVAGNNGSQGVGLVQVYDQDNSTASQLDAIATRGFITNSTGALIGGFSVGGTTSKSVLVRAIGPSLSAYFNNPLTDPALGLYNANGQQIATNNDWATAPNANQIPTSLRPTDLKESAILVTLAPGDYTAIVSGNNGSQGIGLVQVYD